MATREKDVGAEWVGGLVTMPTYVIDEGEPYRPEALFWMSAEGAVLGSTMGKPGTILAAASANLRDTMERPMWGRPHAPNRLRVPTSDLADAIRQGHPELDVVCAPTPELDAMVAVLREKLTEEVDGSPPYLDSGLEPDALASFFRAAAAVYRAKPWASVPDDECLFAVTIEKLGVENRLMSVFGQNRTSFGWVLFSSRDDFDDFAEFSSLEEGERTLPRHFALRFERLADLSATAQKAIEEHGWEIASHDAGPWLSAVDDDSVERPPTTAELSMAEAICLALPEALKEEKALLDAWAGGEPVVRTIVVRTHAGELEVVLKAPYDELSVRPAAPSDLLAAYRALQEVDDELDLDAKAALDEELLRRFSKSPEADSFGDLRWSDYIVDAAADYFGATITWIGPQELEEILFDIMPRKLSVEASVAQEIIDETRAFYEFMKREFGLAEADDCLRVLSGDAATRLRAELSNPKNFGMAKSLFMSGQQAGFDMSTEEGITAWMNLANTMIARQSGQAPASSSSGTPRTSNKAATRQKKKQRKAERKARKKNR